ncbi:chain length determinant protein EpsF [Niveibacterium microcysteis]|uniref:Chain length determinant protein EpsF n=1 Tax=Niveibacterium microcysteis TaxID=2811415 RepID=A0ABX7MG02_9RHOO|nr:chain length determinant protein EpsF [Niveibacterium microcysteis]QSI79022.1 chain length determinant protein EpsF [Niveibacterium microcysteis]
MTLQQFLLTLKARQKTIWIVFFSVVSLVVTLSLVLPKKYTANASVLVDVKSSDPIYGAMMQAQFLPGYMATQVDIITSDRVAQRVVKMLGLDKNQDAIAQWKEEGEGKGTIVSFFAEALQKKLDVRPSRESSVITIAFTGADPAFASSVANAFARAYMDINLELKVEPAKEYASWFGDRAKQLRDSLETAQSRLSAYQREKGIVATDDRLDVEIARYAELSSQLTAIQAQRSDSASRQRQASGSMGTSPDVINSPLIQSLRADVARQEAKLKEMGGQLGQNHPQYQRTEAELNALKAKLDSEMRQVASSVGTSNIVNVQRESELRASLEAQKKRVLELRAQRDEVAVLQRDVETAQRAYDLVGQRLSQTSLESQTQQTNIVVLTPAEPPTKHSSPRLLLNTLLSIFLGGFLGVGTAFLQEMLNRRIRSQEDLFNALGVPVLATLEHEQKPGVRRFGFAGRRVVSAS